MLANTSDQVQILLSTAILLKGCQKTTAFQTSSRLGTKRRQYIYQLLSPVDQHFAPWQIVSALCMISTKNIYEVHTSQSI
jgi:hypothetical protein